MLEIETGLIFWTTVSFGMLVALLYKVALPPLLNFLAMREKMIADSIALAEANQKKTAELLEDQKKKYAQAHQSADQMVERAKEEGRQTKEGIITAASREADKIMEKARLELEREKDKIVASAKQEVVELVAMATGKVLRRVITPEDNRRLIEESIAQVKP
ncbi:MAG: F0F1 ATP synthase subunit B [bacterium]